MSGKAKTILAGSFMGSLAFFANAIISLVMMPFIIHSLGDRMYGLWVFVGSFLGYYGLMDFGLNSAIQRFISKAIGAKDYAEENKIINTALVIFSVIGIVALLASFFIAFFIPFFVKNIVEVGLFRIVVIILGINFAVGFPLRVFSGVLGANVRYDIRTTIELVKLIFRTILIYAALKNGFGIVALSIITMVADLSSYAVKYIYARKLYKHMVISLQLFDKSRIRSLFGYSTYTFIAQIADQMRFNLDNLVITAFLSLNLVTPFSIGARLVKYYGDFIAAVTGILVPVFSQLEAAKRNDILVERFLLTTKISSYLSIIICGLLVIFGRSFIERWMGPNYPESYTILVILVLPSMLGLMQSSSVQLLYGISKHKFFAYTSIIEGVVNLILSIILVKHIGINGVALGTAIPMVISKIFVQPIYTCRAINLSIKKYYFELMVPVVLKSSVLLAIIYLLSSYFIVPNFKVLFVLIGVSVIIFSTAIFYIGFSSKEQEYFKSIILTFTKKVRSV